MFEELCFGVPISFRRSFNSLEGYFRFKNGQPGRPENLRWKKEFKMFPGHNNVIQGARSKTIDHAKLEVF